MPTIPKPPTFPTGSTPVDGWNAAYKAQGFTTPVIVVGPSYVPPGELSSIINNATSKTLLQPGATYIISAVAMAVQSIIGSNNTIIRKPGVKDSRGNAVSSGIGTNAPGLEICGIHFDSQQAMGAKGTARWNDKVGIDGIRVTSPNCNIHDISGSNVDTVVFLDYTASGGQMNNVSADATLRGDLLFVGGTQNFKFSKITGVTSQNEHIIRIDRGSNNLSSAGFLTFDELNLANTDGKEPFADRDSGGGPVTIANSTFSCAQFAGVRAGQVVPAGSVPPLKCAANITLRACHFINGAYIQMDQGTAGAIVDQCAFDWAPHNVPIRFQGPNCGGSLTRNILSLNGQKFDGRIWIAGGQTASDIVNESGTVDEKGNALKQA